MLASGTAASSRSAIVRVRPRPRLFDAPRSCDGAHSAVAPRTTAGSRSIWRRTNRHGTSARCTPRSTRVEPLARRRRGSSRAPRPARAGRAPSRSRSRFADDRDALDAAAAERADRRRRSRPRARPASRAARAAGCGRCGRRRRSACARCVAAPDERADRMRERRAPRSATRRSAASRAARRSDTCRAGTRSTGPSRQMKTNAAPSDRTTAVKMLAASRAPA